MSCLEEEVGYGMYYSGVGFLFIYLWLGSWIVRWWVIYGWFFVLRVAV